MNRRGCYSLCLMALLAIAFLVFYFVVGLSFFQSMFWSTASIAGFMLAAYVFIDLMDHVGKEIQERLDNYK